MKTPLYTTLFQAIKAMMKMAGSIISHMKLTANAVTIFIGMLMMKTSSQYSALAQCMIMTKVATKLHGVV